MSSQSRKSSLSVSSSKASSPQGSSRSSVSGYSTNSPSGKSFNSSYPIYSPTLHSDLNSFAYLTANPPMVQSPLQHPYDPYFQSSYVYQSPLASPLLMGTPNPYESMFLFPQSSIFASYLQTMQNGQGHQQHHQHASSHLPASPSFVKNGPQGMISLPASFMSIPRGPPKKPKQSGYALWVGNLPPSTTLIELCSLFGTSEIQSIFLIQRTLCAFVNYSSKIAMEEGIASFGRRGSSIRGNQLVVKIKHANHNHEEYIDDDDSLCDAPLDAVSPPLANPDPENQDRYFICKSLTVEDLYASVRLGLWATQSHNQVLFNEAYKVRQFNAKYHSSNHCLDQQKRLSHIFCKPCRRVFRVCQNDWRNTHSHQ